MKPVARKAFLATALPLALVAAWWFGTAGSTSFFWPPASQIVEAFVQTWTTDRLASDVIPSLMRLAVGLTLAMVVGVSGGMLIGAFEGLRRTVEPPLELLRAIPPPVLVPVIMLIAGIGDGMKIAVIASGCVWPILLNTTEGVRAVDPVLRDTARSYQLSRARRARTLLLRSASPQIMAGARQALALGIILMVISEMFAASDGVGFRIMRFQRGFAIPEMWSGIIVLGLIGVALSAVFRPIERRILRWYQGFRAAEKAF